GPNGEDFAYALALPGASAEIIGTADYLRNAAVVEVDVNKAGPNGEDYAYAAVTVAGSSPPLTELVFADFKNGVYRLNGTGSAVDDLFVEDLVNWGHWDTDSIQDGVGIVAPFLTFDMRPVVSDAAVGTMVTDGFTFVANFYTTTGQF